MHEPAAYFLCNPAVAGYAGVRDACASAHTQRAPQTLLSERKSPDGTRTIVKIAKADKGFVSHPSVIQKFYTSELSALWAAMDAIAANDSWTKP